MSWNDMTACGETFETRRELKIGEREHLMVQLANLEASGWSVDLRVTLEMGEYRIAQVHESRWIAWIDDRDDTPVGKGFRTMAEAVAAVNDHRSGRAIAGPVGIDADGREVA